MQDQTERWMKLCQQAAGEQDPDRLLALVTEINALLEAKEHHSKQKNASALHTARSTADVGQLDADEQ